MKISASPLPNPPEGYEWMVQPQTVSKQSITFVLCPIRKLYDWSKTGPNVLTTIKSGAVMTFNTAMGPQALAEGVWQAHIGGDPCPVHAEATMVEVRADGIVTHAGKASADDWSYDCIWRVTGLVEGYSYE